MSSIRYYKLFDMLARRGYKKTDLKLEVGFSTVTIAKLSKGDYCGPIATAFHA